MKTIGVIGLGYVGTAVQKGFETIANVVTYDISKECTETSVQGVLSKSQIIFICVPTPMNADGTCNVDIVRNVLSQMVTLQTEYKPICVIKSTVTPGTTNSLAEEFPHLTLCFNPEFLTEKNYINDFMSQVNIILGHTGESRKEVLPVYNLYNERFGNANITFVSAKEAEMIKYVANTFLSTIIAYLNEIYQICQKAGIDYDRITKVLATDSRLGDTHWSVPGHDGHFGFGGTCFPKDINALIRYANQNGQSTPLLNAVWDKNLEVRPEKDWELDKGRAVV
jgi:UDPglucose 6-dehydrogenase